jgi:hypothetical protein
MRDYLTDNRSMVTDKRTKESVRLNVLKQNREHKGRTCEWEVLAVVYILKLTPLPLPQGGISPNSICGEISKRWREKRVKCEGIRRKNKR